MTLILHFTLLLAVCSFFDVSATAQSTDPSTTSDSDALARIELLVNMVRLDIQDLKVSQAQLKKEVEELSDDMCSLNSKTDDFKKMLDVVKGNVAHLEKDHDEITELLTVPHDCQDVFESGRNVSGIYLISPDGIKKMNVYCENDKFSGGWTVIQRRIDGSVSFDQDWQTYSAGFASVDGEHWLGTENIYLLTKNKDKHLKIELVYKDGRETHYADYTSFWLKSIADNYQLNIGGFSSSSLTFDAMARNNQLSFSTKDADRDTCSKNCAKDLGGGWWYGCCSHAYLNSRYGPDLRWYDSSSLKTLSAVRMMVK